MLEEGRVKARAVAEVLIRRENDELAQAQADLVREAPERVQRRVADKVVRLDIRVGSSALLEPRRQLCKTDRNSQCHELPRLFVLLNVTSALDEQQDEDLHTSMVFAESRRVPSGLMSAICIRSYSLP
jgi:hypothetical protein